MPTDTKARARQKSRTRAAMLAAARELLDAGQPVTVHAAAEAAGVSRATAYRYFYFSDPQALTIEAVLSGKVLSPEAVVGDARDVETRVLRVYDYLLGLVRESEPQFRQFLARVLDAWVASGDGAARGARGARRVPMYAYAVGPARDRLTPADFDRLVTALASVSGVEGHLGMKDVCGLDDAAADANGHLIVRALLAAFLGPDAG